MLAIAGAFGLLIRQSFRARREASAPPPVAFLFGIFGALAYALAYIARKAGLDIMATPAFGTFLSAVTGFAGFAALALVMPRYATNLAGVFRHLDRWIVAAAIMVSFGQILMFAALAYESVATVVMIASLEIFISIFLAVVVFRTEPVPGPAIALAALLATGGVILVAAS
jgi:drug/metabolite transporter (DMT)-like permease